MGTECLFGGLFGGQFLLEAAALLGDVDHPDEGNNSHADRPEHGRHVRKVEVHEQGQVLPVGLQKGPVQLLHILDRCLGRFSLQ